MNRSAFAPAVALLFCTALATSAFAQAKPAAAPAAATQAPAVKAKFATPLKGEAPIQVIQSSKRVGADIVTTYKVKSLASAPVAMLRLDEYWYDKTGKNMVWSETYRHRQPLQPGEVIEFSTKTPGGKGAERSQAQFTHANGKVTAKAVKKFE